MSPPTMISKSTRPDAVDKLKEGRARNPIYQGEPINEKKIVLPGDKGFMAAILPKGHRAISVRISAETGAGGFILPNDKVDVILTRKLPGSERQMSETVLTNVRVLAIDQTYQVRTTRAARSSSAKPRPSSSIQSRQKFFPWSNRPASCRWRCAASPIAALPSSATMVRS